MLRSAAASLLSRALAAALPSPPPPPAALAALLPRGASRLYGIGSHVSDNDPEVLAREKARNLSGQTEAEEKAGHVAGAVEGAEGWNPLLASDSEAVVKAERAPEMRVEEMVEVSVRQIAEVTAAAPEGGKAAE